MHDTYHKLCTVKLPPEDELLVYLKHVEDVINKINESASCWFYYTMFIEGLLVLCNFLFHLS
jgi:hypothetical protein